VTGLPQPPEINESLSRAAQVSLAQRRRTSQCLANAKARARVEFEAMVSTMTRETFAALLGAAIVSLTIFFLSLALTG